MGDGAGAFVTMLPISLKNQRKVPYLSPPPTGQAKLQIRPLLEIEEKDILNCLLLEINQNYGLSLDTEPDYTRRSDPMTVTDTRRVVLVGASHMSRTAAAVAAAGGDVIDASSPGWVPSKESCKKIACFVKNLALKDGDALVVDIWSNLAYMGTDEFGIPTSSVFRAEPRKSAVVFTSVATCRPHPEPYSKMDSMRWGRFWMRQAGRPLF